MVIQRPSENHALSVFMSLVDVRAQHRSTSEEMLVVVHKRFTLYTVFKTLPSSHPPYFRLWAWPLFLNFKVSSLIYLFFSLKKLFGNLQ